MNTFVSQQLLQFDKCVVFEVSIHHCLRE